MTRLGLKSKQTKNTLFIPPNPIAYASYLYDLRIVSIRQYSYGDYSSTYGRVLEQPLICLNSCRFIQMATDSKQVPNFSRP